MPIYVKWENSQQTLITVQFISPWDSHELNQMIDDGLSMLNQVVHKVDVIVDFHQASRQVPINYLPAVKRMSKIGLINRGTMVVIGAPYFIKALTGIAQEFAPVAYSNLYFAPELDAALKIIEQHKQNRA